jgi:hypothetical protein
VPFRASLTEALFPFGEIRYLGYPAKILNFDIVSPAIRKLYLDVGVLGEFPVDNEKLEVTHIPGRES